MGTRLRTAVPELPKVLAPVNGRPFLAYLLDQLAGAGFKEVILCTGHLGLKVESSFGQSYKGLFLKYSQEPDQLGTGGALRNALNLVLPGPVLVMNGDSYCDIDLKSYIDWHVKNGFSASLALSRVADPGRYGSVKVDKTGRVLSFQEKTAGAGPALVNGGIYIFEKSLLAKMSPGKKVSLESEFLPGLLDHGLFGFSFPGRFVDIGTPEAYASAEAFFAGLKGVARIE